MSKVIICLGYEVCSTDIDFEYDWMAASITFFLDVWSLWNYTNTACSEYADSKDQNSPAWWASHCL